MKLETSGEEYMSGWTDGYDTNEAEWATRTMAIARKLIDRVDTEAQIQGYLDIEAIKVVVEAFWHYAEHAEITDILDNYIEWCESNGTPRDMKKLMEMKLRGATSA